MSLQAGHNLPGSPPAGNSQEMLTDALGVGSAQGEGGRLGWCRGMCLNRMSSWEGLGRKGLGTGVCSYQSLMESQADIIGSGSGGANNSLVPLAPNIPCRNDTQLLPFLKNIFECVCVWCIYLYGFMCVYLCACVCVWGGENMWVLVCVYV